MPTDLNHHIWSKQYTTAGEQRTRYYVRFRDWRGKKRQYPAGDNLKTARRTRDIMLGKNLDRVDLDQLERLQKQHEQGQTLKDWLARWFKVKRGKKSLDKDHLRAAGLIAFFGEACLLNQITLARIEDFVSQRLQTTNRLGRPYRPATVNRELALLRSILRLAVDHDALPKLPKIRMLDEHNRRDRIASETEYRKLLEHLRPDIRDVIEVLYEQGRRESEILNLTWSQVDWLNEELVFPPNTTKRKAPSRVPMAPRTVEIIRRLEVGSAQVGSVRRTDRQSYVFTAIQGGPIKQRWFHRLVVKAMKQAGIQGLWVHDLRGTFITRMVVDRKHDRTLVKLATDHLTDYAFDRYVRPTREHVREMLRGNEERRESAP